MGIDVPLVGDFHYNGHKLLADYPDCAQALSASTASTRATSAAASSATTQFARMIEIACRYAKPVRIGVNWGSLDQELLARMMDENAVRPEPWQSGAVHARSAGHARPSRTPNAPRSSASVAT